MSQSQSQTQSQSPNVIDFSTLQLSVPESVKLYSIEEQREIYAYLSEIGELERKAYEIAVNHLGPSFNIYRSIGFIAWKKTK